MDEKKREGHTWKSSETFSKQQQMEMAYWLAVAHIYIPCGVCLSINF
jgi:hypothetical protein